MSRINLTPWRYRGNKVYIASTAEISQIFKPEGNRGKLVQQILDQTPPWPSTDQYYMTQQNCNERFAQATMRLLASDSQRVIWGIHSLHRTIEGRDYAPFIRPEKNPQTSTLAITLFGPPKRPIIVRVAPVDPAEPFVPPLPWMKGLNRVRDGKNTSIQYWKSHVYVIYKSGIMVPGSEAPRIPSWYQRLQP